VDHPLAMFEDRPYKRTFYSAPQSVTSLMAAFLEPAITVATFLIANLVLGAMVGRPELVLCLLVFALTFPGRNRFRQNMIEAGVDIVSSWVVLIGVLLLCGYVTRSIN
jgi:putative colanic acid biosynthesis UDP-glucose lipid carrier transferase